MKRIGNLRCSALPLGIGTHADCSQGALRSVEFKPTRATRGWSFIGLHPMQTGNLTQAKRIDSPYQQAAGLDGGSRKGLAQRVVQKRSLLNLTSSESRRGWISLNPRKAKPCQYAPVPRPAPGASAGCVTSCLEHVDVDVASSPSTLPAKPRPRDVVYLVSPLTSVRKVASRRTAQPDDEDVDDAAEPFVWTATSASVVAVLTECSRKAHPCPPTFAYPAPRVNPIALTIRPPPDRFSSTFRMRRVSV